MNAVCPLVTKVHHEAKVRAGKGFTILYVGHAGHDEAVGTLAVAPEAIRLVEHEDDLDDALPAVDDPSKVALLAQTTLALHDWEGIMERTREQFPELWTATRNDLCFATTNRQAALSEIAAEADAVVVIGSANSSNTIALTKVATHRRVRHGRAGRRPRRARPGRARRRAASSASPPVRARRRTSCRRSSPSSRPPTASSRCS